MERTPNKLDVFDLLKTDSGLLQSKELYQYILKTSVYPNEAQVLKELREITASLPGHLMLCGADEGPLMSLLLKLINAKKTIEIGVYTGYSLLVTALALPSDGRDRGSFELGLPLFKKSGVDHKVEFIESIALPVLDKLLEDGSDVYTRMRIVCDLFKGMATNYKKEVQSIVAGNVNKYVGCLRTTFEALSDSYHM
ncbi:hypothetical protein MKW98_018335 [Papaver atlanticum]|uniref:Caffeoyl-CoA O-methyltransferase n=1 Tax=Papaver atlanticum TaxID=357466 RepID=A0AAD4XT63_9MAGN|nr:hypothetical protein MKW98_018335 [Papaver atlanticum]